MNLLTVGTPEYTTGWNARISEVVEVLLLLQIFKSPALFIVYVSFSSRYLADLHEC